jgi:hypothetical protein
MTVRLAEERRGGAGDARADRHQTSSCARRGSTEQPEMGFDKRIDRNRARRSTCAQALISSATSGWFVLSSPALKNIVLFFYPKSPA